MDSEKSPNELDLHIDQSAQDELKPSRPGKGLLLLRPRIIVKAFADPAQVAQREGGEIPDGEGGFRWVGGEGEEEDLTDLLEEELEGREEDGPDEGEDRGSEGPGGED